MPSWEYYQQPENANRPYPLWWICGAASSYDITNIQNEASLFGEAIHAVPFDQLRNVTVSKISIYVTQPQPNINGRLAIYQNASNSDNRPNNLVVDAGTVSLSSMGTQTKNINTNLTANTRYWAALQTTNIAANAPVRIRGIPYNRVIFWGALYNPGGTPPDDGFLPAIELTKSQTFGTGAPNPFPTVGGANVLFGAQNNAPAIALAFSSVT